EKGVPPEALLNGLALLGWAPAGDRTIVGVEEILEEFTLDRIGRSAAVFDPVKLSWISGQHIHAMTQGRLAAAVGGALVAAGRLDPAQGGSAPSWIEGVAAFLRPALSRFDQVGEQVEPLFHPGGALDEEAVAALGSPGASAVLESLAARLAGSP